MCAHEGRPPLGLLRVNGSRAERRHYRDFLVAITLGQNIASLTAQRGLNASSSALQDTFVRLSSGLRINRASDDAAGLAIAVGLKTDSIISSQAVRNISDGISALSIADGAIGELTEITIRIKELATEAANGSLSSKQRIALDAEAQALASEYSRIVSSSSFNGRAMIDGTFVGVGIQAGDSSSDQIALSISAVPLIGPAGTGDGTLQSYVSFTTSASRPATDAELADLNGDGLLDMVTTDNGSTLLSIQLGNTDGSFKAGSTYNSTGTPQGLALADFDKDGKIDMVYGAAGGKVMFRKGGGDGTFGIEISFNVNATPTDIEYWDLNNDGNLDLVEGSSGGTYVGVMLGNGNGTFKTEVTYGGVAEIELADVNGDGRKDLLSHSAAGDLLVSFGNSNGSFAAGTLYSDPYGNVYGIVARDFNGDGAIDIAENGIAASAEVMVFLNNGNGTFKSAVSYATFGFIGGDVASEDLNNDGFNDLIAYSDDNISTVKVSVLLGNGNGTFKAKTDYTIAGAIGAQTNLSIAKLGTDNVFDIVNVSQQSSTYSVLYGNSSTPILAGAIGVNLLTQTSALASMTTATSTIAALSVAAGSVGAQSSRLETAFSVVSSQALSLNEAYSRIMDADVAAEVAQMIRLKILQQAGAAVLAQANQAPALALQLLEIK